MAWPFLEWTVLIVEATAGLPLFSVEVGRFDVFWLALYYVLLFGSTRVSGADLWHMALERRSRRAGWQDARLFFDTDGGSATLVRTPTGRRVLIGGGLIFWYARRKRGELVALGVLCYNTPHEIFII